MNLQLIGKRALVTGSSDGIGKVIATSLAAEGAAVAVHGRDEKRTRAVVEKIQTAGGRAIAVFGDITKDSDVDEIVGTSMRELGSVDILVNNAGGSGDKQISPSLIWTEHSSTEARYGMRNLSDKVPILAA